MSDRPTTYPDGSMLLTATQVQRLAMEITYMMFLIGKMSKDVAAYKKKCGPLPTTKPKTTTATKKTKASATADVDSEYAAYEPGPSAPVSTWCTNDRDPAACYARLYKRLAAGKL